jgi:hypothetical protein
LRNIYIGKNAINTIVIREGYLNPSKCKIQFTEDRHFALKKWSYQNGYAC